jgi:hypothetical protein
LDGVKKTRFATTMDRVKVLMRNGHTDIELQELPYAMTKDEIRAFFGEEAKAVKAVKVVAATQQVEATEEDAADAFAAGQVLQAAVEGTGGTDNPAMADWLRANEVETILGPLSWDEIGRPQGDFLLGQWQSGAVEIVAPSIAATIDKIINPKPAWTN